MLCSTCTVRGPMTASTARLAMAEPTPKVMPEQPSTREGAATKRMRQPRLDGERKAGNQINTNVYLERYRP